MASIEALSDIRAKLRPTTTVVRPHPCIAIGVEQFGRYALGQAGASKEIGESEAQTVEHAHVAAEIIRNSSCVVVHTGAGISTSSGIGDFRGPNGVWTQLANGMIPDDSFDITESLPTFAHMAIKALIDVGIVKGVISTNHDGLHMKSGLRIAENLHELHGNVYVENCVTCSKQYQRQFPVLRTADRYTGRNCTDCGGKLWDSSIDFGQTLPKSHLHAAEALAKKADLHIVLGSSLQVSPACLLPRQYGGKLILVNKGETPVDKNPSGKVPVRSYGDIDKFMKSLLDELDITPSPSPTLATTGFLSTKMLLKRRLLLREQCVKALSDGVTWEVDPNVPEGWSHHIDEESADVDYWFHQPSNQISFGRPIAEDETLPNLKSPPSGDSGEERAIPGDTVFASAAPTVDEARKMLKERSLGKGSPEGKRAVFGSRQESSYEGKGKGNGKSALKVPPPPPPKGRQS